MENFATLFLFLLGTCFGSFASVAVYRLKSGKPGILTGRSECGNCGKTLGWTELVPVFSWLFQRGKCAGCGSKVSFVYPLLEIVTGALFALSGRFLSDLSAALSGDLGEIGRIAFFCAVAYVTVTYVFYDLLYQEIPDEILVPAILVTAGLLGFFPESPLFRHFEPFFWNGTAVGTLANAAIGAAAIYAFFYLQFLIPAGLHCLKAKRYRDAAEIVWFSVALPFVVAKETLFGFFGKKRAEPSESEEADALPTWIGLGDLRIAVFMGFVAGAKIAFLGLFFAYLVGSVVGTYVLAVEKRRNVAIPFGPFLAAGLYLSLFFYGPAVSWVFPASVF